MSCFSVSLFVSCEFCIVEKGGMIRRIEVGSRERERARAKRRAYMRQKEEWRKEIGGKRLLLPILLFTLYGHCSSVYKKVNY